LFVDLLAVLNRKLMNVCHLFVYSARQPTLTVCIQIDGNDMLSSCYMVEQLTFSLSLNFFEFHVYYFLWVCQMSCVLSVECRYDFVSTVAILRHIFGCL